MRSLIRIALPVLFISVILGALHAQDTEKRIRQTPAAIAKMITDSNMVFKAENVLVSGGNVTTTGSLFNGTNTGPSVLVTLNSNSYFTIKPTILTSSLPWFDLDHYTKPATDKHASQTVESTGFYYDVKNFNYTVKQLKSGQYEITISPRNAPGSRYFLEIDTDGKAKLTVFLGSSSISYLGHVTQQV